MRVSKCGHLEPGTKLRPLELDIKFDCYYCIIDYLSTTSDSSAVIKGKWRALADATR